MNIDQENLRRTSTQPSDGDVERADCTVPPEGWRCIRKAGHDGPCAAMRATDDKLVDVIRSWLMSDEHPVSQWERDFATAIRAALSPTPPQDEAVILKGTGKINGDGFKDTTVKGEVVFVWNTELPSPCVPGQYPRLSYPVWSASTEQYDFVVATAADIPAIIAALSTQDEGRALLVEAWQPIETAPKDGTHILAYGPLPGYNAATNDWCGVRETHWKCYPKGSPGFSKWEAGEGPLGLGWDWYEPVHNWSHSWNPTHWMPLPAPPLTRTTPTGEA